jgi:hypothetical protein
LIGQSNTTIGLVPGHLSVAGYQKLADSIDLGLLVP